MKFFIIISFFIHSYSFFFSHHSSPYIKISHNQRIQQELNHQKNYHNFSDHNDNVFTDDNHDFEQELKNLNYNLRNKTFHKNFTKYNNKYPFSQKYFEDSLKRLVSDDPSSNDTNYNNPNKINSYVMPKIVILDSNGDEFNLFGKKIHSDDNNRQIIKSKNFEIIKNSSVSFNDIGGYDEVKNELYQIINFIKFPHKYKQFNVRLPKGIIFEGLPGTGKTLFAKALATEANCNFIVASGSDFAMKFIGEGVEKIKELFNLANKNKPCIIFIDEIDAVGKKRSDDGQSASKEHDNTLNSLLVELNGFSNSDGVLIIGATNRVDLLDPALIRPGRIDKIIHIPFPNSKARQSIIQIHSKGKPFDNSVSIDHLVDITQGLSGAQIENILNEAMLFAIRNNKTFFNIDDFDYIFDKTIVGWQPIEHEYNNETILQIAIHEIGHALVGYFSENYPKIKKISINLNSPTSPGYTVFEHNKSNLDSKQYIFQQLVILISGRVAESIIYGDDFISTGAHGDFKRIHDLAHRYIIDFGMSNLGFMSTNSDRYLTLLDNEINRIIHKIEHISRNILIQHKDTLLYLGKLLATNKNIYFDEFEQIIKEKIRETS